MKGPYISRVQIKNFRNFKDVDVVLTHKQVVVGENNVGKTNFLRAIQLILDPTFSDQDRFLQDSDFHDSLESPMKNGEEILIAIEVQGFEHNRKLKAQFVDASVSDTPPTLRFTYKFRPVTDEDGEVIRYEYIIIKADNENEHFNNIDRAFINIKVIRALRDVERELNANRRSPLYQIVKIYEISDDELDKISDELKKAADHILELDEIKDIKATVQSRFGLLTGASRDNEIDLSTFDFDPNRVLYTLQVLLGNKKRPVSEASLGLCNILYMTLILLLLKDRTVPTILKYEKFKSLTEKDAEKLLNKCYEKNANGKYILNEITEENYERLYSFMSQYLIVYQPFTILAVEEPESHLHPLLQRIVYKEVLHKSENSVIFTTHSTFITSIAPINTIVHIGHKGLAEGAKVWSSANISLSENEEADIERYLDAKRGELYFGRGVILVEGITEEYLIPASAKLMGYSLDSLGVVVCNINATNFRPYVGMLSSLSIPWCVITDGDFYLNSGGKKQYHQFRNGGEKDFGYLGLGIVKNTLVELGLVKAEKVPDDLDAQFKFFAKHGCFLGEYTMEVDIMGASKADGIKALKKTFGEVKKGGAKQQNNFDTAIDRSYFWSALAKIESPGIGKGRFAQRFAANMVPGQIPKYVQAAIKFIAEAVSPKTE